MNENLIPQVVLDLAQKYVAATDSNELTNLEMRINDIVEYLESVRRLKKGKNRKSDTYRDLIGRGGLGNI
jgi:hypothetical protein